MSQTLFTVEPNPDVGLTDQLLQIFVCYQLGVSCGFEFRLILPTGARSDERLWERYDLRRHFTPLSETEEALPAVKPDLSEETLRARGIRDLPALVSLVLEQLGPDHRLVRFQLGSNRSLLVPMVIAASSVAMRDFQGRMRSLFAPRAPWPAEGRLRVACHLRCGDATDVPTFANRTYRVWHRRVAPASEDRPTPFLAARLVLDHLAGHLPAPGIDARVFTDGYGRTGRVIEGSRVPDGPLSPAEAELLGRSIRLHEAVAGFLMQGPGIRFECGESFESLQLLLESVQQADFLVITGNQRMIPKFLTLLGDSSRRPAVLLMERLARHVRSVRGAGLTEQWARLITLSEHGDPLAPLRAFLEHQHEPGHAARMAPLADASGAGLFCVPEIEQLAQQLEAAGRMADAVIAYRWLARLTDRQPRSLAGLERCLRLAGEGALADVAHGDWVMSVRRGKEAVLAEVQNLRARGRQLDALALLEKVVDTVGPVPGLAGLREELRKQSSVSVRNRHDTAGESSEP